MKIVKQVVAVLVWCVASVGCGAEEPFTPTPEQMAAKEKTRTEVLNLFDSLPQIPDTEMELVESKKFSGRHHFTLQGNYQSYETRLETVLYSNTDPEAVCKAYQKYIGELSDEWVKPENLYNEKICSYENKDVSGFSPFNKRVTKEGGSLFIDMVIRKGSVQPKNGRVWKTKIEFTARYTLNVKASQACSPKAHIPDEWHDGLCVGAGWRESMAR